MSTRIIVTCGDCRHRGVYRSQSLADFHFPRHSCATVLERKRRRRARQATLAGAGEKRDCQHKHARHQHGTRNAYVLDRCRCHPCKVAHRAYEQDRRRKHAYGLPGDLVDAQPAREHIQQLMWGGMGLKRIVALSGLGNGSVSTILYGKGGRDPREHRRPRKRITRVNSDAILAVKLDRAPGALVCGTGTTRRIQAMVAGGWSQSKLSVLVGFSSPANFTRVVHGRSDVTRATADKVRALYDELWDQEPPHDTHRDQIAHTRSKRYAAGHGWLPPLAWDDDLIDDPTYQPEVVEPISLRGPDALVVAEDVEFLHDDGLRLDAIAARLGVKRGTLQTALQRQGRRDLWQQISRREELARTAPRRVA